MNFFFSLNFFEKSSLTFSHFEFYYKYVTLAMRVFYYDGALMEGMFAFQTDFSNTFLQKKFLRFKQRNQRFLGSRNGRFFLFIFYGFFRFSNFFKAKYLKNQKILQKGSLNFRLYLRRQERVIRFLSLRRRLKRKKRALAKAKAIAKAKAQGKVYVPYRKPRKHVFFSYGPLFHSKSRGLRLFRQRGHGRRPFRPRVQAQGSRGFPWKGRVSIYGRRRPFGSRGLFGQKYALRKGAAFQGKGFPSRRMARSAHFHYKKKWNSSNQRKPLFFKPDPQLIALRRQRLLERKRRRAVFKIFKGILRHCRLGRLGFYLKKVR